MKIITDFEHNSTIPSKYTCDGEDIAPVLNIEDVPENTKEIVLIVDDPDAPMGTWVHWLLYNMPADTKVIDEDNLPQGTLEGFTSFKRLGWGGPCPPNGMHRYFFKLYALNDKTNLKEGATKAQIEDAMQGKIIEKAELIGLYDRI